jgi:hypothetical protein
MLRDGLSHSRSDRLRGGSSSIVCFAQALKFVMREPHLLLDEHPLEPYSTLLDKTFGSAWNPIQENAAVKYRDDVYKEPTSNVRCPLIC